MDHWTADRIQLTGVIWNLQPAAPPESQPARPGQ
jgi:hypothetical protein